MSREYLTKLVCTFSAILARTLRSVNTTNYNLPRLRTSYRVRRKSYLLRRNPLPKRIRHQTSSNCFKRQLETFLFRRAFSYQL